MTDERETLRERFAAALTGDAWWKCPACDGDVGYGDPHEDDCVIVEVLALLAEAEDRWGGHWSTHSPYAGGYPPTVAGSGTRPFTDSPLIDGTTTMSNEPSKTYLLCGPVDKGVEQARAMAERLNGDTNEPDYIEMDAADPASVEDARELRLRAMYAPDEGRYKVYVVKNAEHLTPLAWQALDKLTDEPESRLVFVLVTSNPQAIVSAGASVVSRARRLDVESVA